MTEAELKTLAKLVAEEMKVVHHACCHLTEEEQLTIKDVLRTRKRAVMVFFYVVGALSIWILKDIYNYIMGHFKWGGS